jgi:DNA modification methylase
MTPFYSDDWLTLYGGDCREVLASLPANSVDCVVTSPPYWGLRDYGNEGQLGLERTPEEYVANMVAVFAEVRRVLKPSGTCWLNLGDSYSTHAAGKVDDPMKTSGLAGVRTQEVARKLKAERTEYRNSPLPEKNLVGIPWRVAFALQADGWYLRSDIIWSKPNPMPESVTDRPTKSHEYLFLLTKSPRYYFDADAVREKASQEPNVQRMRAFAQRVVAAGGDQRDKPGVPGRDGNGKERRVFLDDGVSRNIRSVWTIATRPYPGAHFAVFPPELPERCIKAGSPSGGVVLDPFGGSGTVGMVANRLSRRAVLIDLNPNYLQQQMKRNAQTPLGLDAA